MQTEVTRPAVSGNELRMKKAGIDLISLCIGVVLLMFKSHRILYIRYVSDAFIYYVALLFILVYILYAPTRKAYSIQGYVYFIVISDIHL